MIRGIPFSPGGSVRTLMFVLLMVLSALLLGGCSPEPGEQARLRIGTNVWPGYEPLYLARDLGYFDSTPVKLVEYPSASEVIRAFRNGAIEAAALTLDEVLLLQASGLSPRVVLVMDISDGGDVIIGRAGLGGMRGLKGRRVGVEDTALGAYVLSRALEIHDLGLDDIEVVPTEVGEHEAAFKDGKVDAVVTFEPVRTNLLAAGAEQLFDSTQIPGEVVDVLVVRQSYLDQHGGAVRQLLKKWFDTLAYQDREPDDTARRISRRLGITPEEFLQSLEGLKIPDHRDNVRLIGGDAPMLVQSAQRLQKTMTDHGLLKALLPVAELIDGSAL